MNSLFRYTLSLIFLLSLGSEVLFAQNSRITLEECIREARKSSPAAKIARKQYESSYWNYKSFKSGFLPQVSLTASLPGFSRSIVAVPQDDGSQLFTDQNFASSRAGISVTQRIAPTGGRIFLNSNLSQITQLGANGYQDWSTTPISLGYSQPLFQFNQDKWQRKTEPIRYEIAEVNYLESIEDATIELVGKYFDVYVSMIEIENAEYNLKINDSIFTISQGRYKVGKIAENDLLQTELALMKARSSLETSRLNYERSLRDLLNTLGWFGQETVELSNPPDFQPVNVDESFAVSHALQARSEILNNELRALEAEQNLARAKWSNRFSADLNASVGLAQSGTTLPEAYQNPRDQQSANITLSVPILNWGKNRAEINIAEAERERTEMEVEVAQNRLSQEVRFQVLNFKQLQDQVRIAAKSDTIAQRRFEVAKNRYLVGKIDITNLQLAQTEKDQARTNYIRTLREFWIAYYQLRRSTLYDWQGRSPLRPDEEFLKP